MASIISVGPLEDVLHRQGKKTSDAFAFEQLIFLGLFRKVFEERAQGKGKLAQRLGLGGQALITILALYLPDNPPLMAEDYVAFDENEEQGWLRDLLERNRSTPGDGSRWLAAIIARRSLEAGHLWEDLGLPDRPALRRLMERYFAPLADRNKNMRWKRFFYRCLCEEEGLSHCTSPTCSACPEIAECFEPESAEAMIARSKLPPV